MISSDLPSPAEALGGTRASRRRETGTHFSDHALMDRFQTARIRAERLSLDHLAELCAMHRDPRVMATLGGVRSDESTRNFLAANLSHWERHGFGLWILRDEAGRFLGRAGIRHLDIEGNDEIELAYAFLADYWGRGLATEIARALLATAWTQLNLPNLVGYTTTANVPSRRVLEKVGFAFERTLDYAGEACVLYRIRCP
jgi:[ribosomal protein S5]-alanine N-acetyltransferase